MLKKIFLFSLMLITFLLAGCAKTPETSGISKECENLGDLCKTDSAGRQMRCIGYKCVEVECSLSTDCEKEMCFEFECMDREDVYKRYQKCGEDTDTGFDCEQECGNCKSGKYQCLFTLSGGTGVRYCGQCANDTDCKKGYVCSLHKCIPEIK